MSAERLRRSAIELARAARAARVPYVHARVVLAEAPTSAKPGDEALVLPDGTIEGFVGGTCAESTVLAQGLALIDSGESLLLRITPTPEPDSRASSSSTTRACRAARSRSSSSPCCRRRRWWCSATPRWPTRCVRSPSQLGWDVPEPTTAMTGVGPVRPWSSSATAATRRRRSRPRMRRRGRLHRARRQPQAGGGGARIARRLTRRSRAACTRPPGSTSAPVERRGRAVDHGRDRVDPAAAVRAGRSPNGRRRAPRPSTRCAGCRSPPSSRHSTSTATTARVWFCGSGCLRAFAADPSAYPLVERRVVSSRRS